MSDRTIIAFDFGRKSIGIAIGQELICSVRALTALKVYGGLPNWHYILKLIKEWQPDLLLIGLPLNMDGSEQLVTKQARQFANSLHNRFGIPITLHDERLSTIEARAHLFNQGGFRALNKRNIDSTSAGIILKSWFEYKKH